MTESAVAHGDTLRGSPGTQPRLTPRELEVLRLLALGKTWLTIRAELGIASATLAHHRRNIAKKCGGGSLVDLLRAVGWLRVPA